ncbi:hypothetical protein FKM82_006710 [Ascaphus truei]
MSASCGLWYRGREGLCLLLMGILLTWLVPDVTESQNISLQPGNNITILIKPGGKSPPSPPCYICTIKDGCKLSTLQIRPGMNVIYNYSCLNPEKYFVMEIQKVIDCTSSLCPFGNVALQPSSLPGLNRTFSWHVATARNMGLELNFSTPWLRQINSSDKCPDLVTFDISTSLRNSPVNIGTFCRNGTVSRIKVQGGGIVALYLPWYESLTQSGFRIANQSSIKRLCIIESTFQTESSATLLSANYDLGFPEDELMTWQFIVPPNHRASVQFLNYTLPNCDRKTESVEYYLPESYTNPVKLDLQKKQPASIGSNFNMSLQGCDMDDKNPGALRLLFTVTVQQSSMQGYLIYHVDLTKEKDMNVSIKQGAASRAAFVPVCVICKGPTDCDKELNLTGGKYYKISILCDNLANLVMTAEKTIACWDLQTCNVKNMALTVPPSLIALPVRLAQITWNLISPVDISAEIASRSMNLQQQVPEQLCNTNENGFDYQILSSNNKDNLNIGIFCPNGSIERIQMRDNVTIAMRPHINANGSSLLKHDLHVSFVPIIKEECIFTMNPTAGTTVHLQTPDWERGLPDYVTVSWSIAMPKKQAAKLAFVKDRVDIVCNMGRFYINIKEQKANGVDIARREDDPLPSPLDLYYPFWVNISNCKPTTNSNKLRVQLSVTFNQTSSGLTIILIAAIAAVGAVILAVTVTVCCVRKKKKEKLAPVGIYDGKLQTEMPRRRAFFKKGKKKNDSHIYAVIEDTMVYGHLLKDPNGSVSPEVDVYQPFEGPMEDAPPVPRLNFLNGSTKEEDLEDHLSLSMRENELYVSSELIPKEPVENDDTSMAVVEGKRNGTLPST